MIGHIFELLQCLGESGSFRDTCTQCEWSRHRISQIYLHRMRLGEFGEIVKQVWSHRRQTEFQLSWGSHIYRLCALCWIRKSLFKHKNINRKCTCMDTCSTSLSARARVNPKNELKISSPNGEINLQDELVKRSFVSWCFWFYSNLSSSYFEAQRSILRACKFQSQS